MKFESKFGLGEIVYIRGVSDAAPTRGSNVADDEIGKVIAVHFLLGQAPVFTVRYLNRAGYQVSENLVEQMLIGDPEFDQDAGGYPEEEK